MSLRRFLITSALTCAALLSTGLTASAAVQPRGELYLSIATKESDTGDLSFVSTADLTCGPTGGTHSDAMQACLELMLADGDFDALRGEDAICTMEYDPVIATAEGRWRDQVVAWQREFSNACMLQAATGAVFRL
jgi:hypothetical protein